MKGRITRNFCLFSWIILSGCLVEIIGILEIYNSFNGWFTFDFGLIFYIYPILKVMEIRFNSNIIKQIILFFGFLIAIELFFDDSLRCKRIKRKCTIPFEAKCISFAQAGASTYIPIYRYHINGKTNMFYGNSLSSANPRLGEVITVFVNRKNENEVYCPTAKAILMLRYIIGFIILFFSTGALMIL